MLVNDGSYQSFLTGREERFASLAQLSLGDRLLREQEAFERLRTLLHTARPGETTARVDRAEYGELAQLTAEAQAEASRVHAALRRDIAGERRPIPHLRHLMWPP